MRSSFTYYIKGLIFITIISVLTGCYKFEGDQTIPAYVSINSINIDTYYPEQGSNSSNISDVWVYMDDALIGIYDFKPIDSVNNAGDTIKAVIFPVLASGTHKLEIRAGIKLNGISSTRAPYPFYKPIVYDNFEFVPGTTKALGNITTTYLSTTKFAWLEDFEGADITFTKIDVCELCDTNIMKTSPANNPIAYLSTNSKYSGIINLTEDRYEYGGTSYNSFDIPTQGSYTLLEMDFKTNNYLSVGVLIRDQYEFVEKQLVILNPTDEWKKIYINLGSNLSYYPLAYDYSVIFRAGLEDDNTEAEILIDNIKVAYR